MSKKDTKIAVKVTPVGIIEDMIYIIRGQKVMLDRDLAELYGVTTGNLNKAVNRNLDRFPEDFVFRLTKKEFKNLRFHFGISNLRSHFVTSSWGGRRYTPFAFTEQGVAMLSSVLNSKRAIQVNIAIMRTFIKLRQMISTHKEMRRKIEEMEARYDKQFKIVFTALKELLDYSKEAEKPKTKIGFHPSR
ncbi:MAG: ORF6N domain-containing protein [Candidatus Omnitrophica bacterium]|nr:ORF6N domain-containing protein [Candidatus Omnitrophota bacterium]